jgi:hypothetical protein
MKKYEVTVKANDGVKTTHKVNANGIDSAVTIAKYNYDGEIVKVEEVTK